MKKFAFFMLFVLYCNAVISAEKNFVIIYADAIGWSDMGFVNEKIETPNINTLKNDGLFYARAYAASPESSPNAAALMTGKFPLAFGLVRDIDEKDTSGAEFQTSETAYDKFKNRAWLPLDEVTYAERLKEYGYFNCFIGKWHLGNGKYSPKNQGFDEVSGVSENSIPQSFYPPYFDKGDAFSDVSGEKYLTDAVTDKAVSFIEGYKGDKPFQLTVSYYGIKGNAMGRKDIVDRYVKKGISARDAQHYAMVTAVDEAVGRIREIVEKTGRKENTVIIFLSSRGNSFNNAPLRGNISGDDALYEGGVRVPMIIYYSGMKAAGTICNYPVMSTDIYPTLIEFVTGKRCKDKLDGMNLGATFDGQNINSRNLFIYRSYDIQYGVVMKGFWKLVIFHDGRRELYNLGIDATEQRSLRTNYPAVADGLYTAFERWLQITPPSQIVP